jgi:hypothetical protein
MAAQVTDNDRSSQLERFIARELAGDVTHWLRRHVA